MLTGLFDLPWWGYVVYTLVATHITIAAVTIYLHRHQAHRALDLHPLPSHFFRFWLWLTTGMVTKAWTAIHRKHHAKCETAEDPHSPQIFGIRKVLLEGAELYRTEADNSATLERYGHGTPDDWMERNLYGRYNMLGIVLLLAINVVLFGVLGLTIWAVQMAWIPLLSSTASVISGATVISSRRMRAGTSCRGAFSSAARSCTTTTTPTPARPACPTAGTSSTSVGSTSG
jgi:stearoyl-CoA desaturase (Delta-9 desaturase)